MPLIRTHLSISMKSVMQRTMGEITNLISFDRPPIPRIGRICMRNFWQYMLKSRMLANHWTKASVRFIFPSKSVDSCNIHAFSNLFRCHCQVFSMRKHCATVWLAYLMISRDTKLLLHVHMSQWTEQWYVVGLPSLPPLLFISSHATTVFAKNSLGRTTVTSREQSSSRLSFYLRT